MNQERTIELENNGTQPIKTVLKLKLVPPIPKTTVHLYLNKALIETLEVKDKFKLLLRCI